MYRLVLVFGNDSPCPDADLQQLVLGENVLSEQFSIKTMKSRDSLSHVYTCVY